MVSKRNKVPIKLSLSKLSLSKLSGKGGAIALEGGKIRIENSWFINNSAPAFGGTIFSSRGTVLDLDGTYMEPGKHHETGNEDILYSLGNTSVTRAVFNATTLTSTSISFLFCNAAFVVKLN